MLSQVEPLLHLPRWEDGGDLGSLSKAIGLTVLFFGVSLLVILHELLLPPDKRQRFARRKWKLPPGPRGLPIIGNLLLYYKGPKAGLEIAKYGEMTTTRVGSKLWIVLNSNRLVNALYARHGSVTNERPQYPMLDEAMSHSQRSVLLPIHSWTERRRVMHQLLTGSSMIKYQAYQDEESRLLLLRYLEHPKYWYRHNFQYANTVIHRITFGEKPGKPEEMEDVNQGQYAFLVNLPPFNLWDCFPELSKLPRFMQWWRGKYEAIGRFTEKASRQYWNPRKARIEQGIAPPSFAADIILGVSNFQGSDEDQMGLSMQLIEAGSDTTRLTINLSLMAFVVAPEAFRKARLEVEKVCGPDACRLPTFNDEPNLLYITAFAKELLRWRGIFVWTPEHVLTKDLEFEDYVFPQGTCFLINHVGIAKDPNNFTDPDKFMPERWLDGSNELDFVKEIWQFGAGRRVCVGARLGGKSLYIAIARLVYCFDFTAREPFDTTKTNAFVPGEPFPIDVTVRSEKYAELIRKEAAGVEV